MKAIWIAVVSFCLFAGGWFVWHLSRLAMDNAAAFATHDREQAKRHGAIHTAGAPDQVESAATGATDPATSAQERESAELTPPPAVRPASGAAGGSPETSARSASAQWAAVWPRHDGQPGRDAAAGRSPAPPRQSGPDERTLALTAAALASEPDNIAALRDRAAALAALERWREAGEALERLVRLEPESLPRRVQYADALARQSLWTAALSQFRWIADRQTDDPRAWYNVAVAHQALGHLSDARAAWDRVIALEPENADAHARRGEILADLQDWAGSAADFEAALRGNPDATDAALNQALALGRLGQNGDARRVLLMLLDRQPRCAVAMARMAELCWTAYAADPAAAGADRRAAADWCRKSLAIDPTQPEVEALLRQAGGNAAP